MRSQKIEQLWRELGRRAIIEGQGYVGTVDVHGAERDLRFTGDARFHLRAGLGYDGRLRDGGMRNDGHEVTKSDETQTKHERGRQTDGSI